uniref:60S ribosomal protein L13 n=1 Tax=Albugo laibachii Nc14 TaxID=890382 RepID=F0VZJ7_9STRA|nr:60S ribosomal protein L13 putative [Albugo laibachii Nc14]|eukprot:CCA14227.1 60S ribosomal protein L13 putative [Albugo laibachii Nc14]
MKHNNVIPNGHFHKDWQNRIKTWFDQAAKKKSRRLRRKAKVAAYAPRPAAGLLRPAVHCPTIKYASKVRAGKGFTLEELKAAGISRKQALSIGIAVDFRRTNKSVESLQANVNRLKTFKAKLIIFPRKGLNKPKQGDSSAEETKKAVQHVGAILPITRAAPKSESAVITEEMRSTSAYSTLRVARADARMAGRLKKRLEDKAAEK